MDMRLIRTPHYYGQFALSMWKESPYTFNLLNIDSLLIRALPFHGPLSVHFNGSDCTCT